MAADFCLFTGVTILMQPRSYVHMSTTKMQSERSSAQGSVTAPSRAKRCCSQGHNVSPRVSVGTCWGIFQANAGF